MKLPSTVRPKLSERINVRAVFATLASVLALVGLAAVVGVALQVRELRANRRSPASNVRNADFGSQR